MSKRAITNVSTVFLRTIEQFQLRGIFKPCIYFKILRIYNKIKLIRRHIHIGLKKSDNIGLKKSDQLRTFI